MKKNMAIKEKIEYLNYLVNLTEQMDRMYENEEEERKEYMLKWEETKEEWYEELIAGIDRKLNAIEQLKEDLEELSK